MGKFIDMAGWVMAEHGVPESRLTVIEKDHKEIRSSRTQIYWKCLCSCGNYVIVPTHRLWGSKKPTRSCGCLGKEKIQQQGFKNKKFNRWSNQLEDENGEYYIGYTSNTNEPFYVDAQDFDIVKDFCWRVHHPSKTSPDFTILIAYGVLDGVRKNVKMHQLIGCNGWDHIDHNELNNRRYNLRKASQLDNVRNSKKAKNNTSGFIGVSRYGISKWRARIMIDHKEIPLGYFDDIEDAIRARLEGEAKYFGEFAPQRHLFEQYGISEDNINE